jgi:hypothetical protein
MLRRSQMGMRENCREPTPIAEAPSKVFANVRQEDGRNKFLEILDAFLPFLLYDTILLVGVVGVKGRVN